jgi:hypothetical protein
LECRAAQHPRFWITHVNNNATALDLLRQIVANVHFQPSESKTVTQVELNNLDFATGTIGPKGIRGIRHAALPAIADLAELLFRSSPDYQRGCTYGALRDRMARAIVEDLVEHSSDSVTADDLARLTQRVESWFSTNAGQHENYVPCILPPRAAPAFSVGPVLFTFGEHFVEHQLKPDEMLYEVTVRPLLEAMSEGTANWMATVTIDRCLLDRARELADLAVDLALVGVQLAMQTDDSKYVARLSARTVPRYRASLSRSAGATAGGLQKQIPGVTFGDGVLELVLTQRKDILQSVGSRIATFIHPTAGFRVLETAWADAAYWFHEGLAEPLDTIAVTKLETCIEVMLRAEKTGGSERRVREAFEAFYGLKPDELVTPKSQITVKQLAKDFVRDRSRILHGTWSTLTHSLRLSRQNLEAIAGGFLANYTVGLDHYIQSSNATDALEPFLAFARAHTAKKRHSPPSAQIVPGAGSQ